MLSPPLRGRPASSAEQRLPAYRRSTSLGVAAASASRARPTSMVTLSTGRTVLATPAPRRDYNPSLARALAALEVPGARVPRVLQGRRLYGSTSSGALGSAGSSISPSSPVSPAALSSELGSLRLRPRVLDAAGRLSRSRSGVLGELKERAELPLTRTRSTVFGSRAGSQSREDKPPAGDCRRSCQQRPLSAAAAVDTAGTQTDVTSAGKSDISLGRNSSGGREASVEDSVSPRRSASRSCVPSAVPDQPARGRGVSNSADPMPGTTPYSVRREDVVTANGEQNTAGDSSRTTGAVPDRLGKEQSAPRASAKAADTGRHLQTSERQPASPESRGTQQKAEAVSRASGGCQAKQGAARGTDASSEANSGRSFGKETMETAISDVTATVSARAAPGCPNKTEKTGASAPAGRPHVTPATPEKHHSVGKPILPDGLSITDQCSSVTATEKKIGLNDSPEASQMLTVPVKPKQWQQELKERKENKRVNVTEGTSKEKADEVKVAGNTEKPPSQKAGTAADQSGPDATPVTTAGKIKKKLVKTPSKVDSEETPIATDSPKADKQEQKKKGVQSNSDQVTIPKNVEVTDDINNNTYVKKTSMKEIPSESSTRSSQRGVTVMANSPPLKPSKESAVPVGTQNCLSKLVDKHVTNTTAEAQKSEDDFTGVVQHTIGKPAITIVESVAPLSSIPGRESPNRLDINSGPVEKRLDVRHGSDDNHLDVTRSSGHSGTTMAVASKATEVAGVMPTSHQPARDAVRSKTSAPAASAGDRNVPKVSVAGAKDASRCQSASSRRVPDGSDAVADGSATTPTVCAQTEAGRRTEPSDKLGPAGPDPNQNNGVRHRDPAGRKSGFRDKDKTANRNAAVVGERLIIGKSSGDVSDVSHSHVPGVAVPEAAQFTERNSIDTAAISSKHTDKSPHTSKSKLRPNAIAPNRSGIPEKDQNDCHNEASVKVNEHQHDNTSQSIDVAVAKKKVKIVKKKAPASAEIKEAKLTTVQNANKLHFPTNNLASLSPFLRADQKKKSSGNSRTSSTVSKPVDDSGAANAQIVGNNAASQNPVKVRKKKTSKTPNASKRSKGRGDHGAEEKNRKHSGNYVCADSKLASPAVITPSHSKSGARRVTKGTKSNSAQLDTEKLKLKSECSSSSESCSSSEEDSEEELSSFRKERRRIREEKEREEARKIEKFRRRGQKAKLKMERLKMEDDPVEYMKNPGNLKFAFMIKQDDWLRKQENEAHAKDNETSQLDRAPADAADGVTSLGEDCLTSPAAARRPSADIDESPFDRRRGPLGGPPPKFRQYAIHDFRLLRVLGQGAFGKVMLARMKDTRNYFAIKCLRKDKIVNDEDVEDTLIERKILTLGTNHPYLCHLFCTFQSPSHLFFVLEFLNGGDLSFHLGQMGRFTAELTRFYASELVCGLRFLHKRGIIYRDLKLDNVLLDHEGHVRIADFGMCKMQIFLDRTADAFCGTVDYMAPEVVSGKNYNQSVDWWSFGIMLYEMLVGLTPFIGLDEDELFWAIRTEQPYYPRSLDPDATEIIKWLLVKDPALRLGSTECPAGGICSQSFFRRVDWYAVERKQHDPPPFRPTLMTMADCRYFEDDYTALPARLTTIPDGVLQQVRQDRFAGFDYTNPNMTD